MELRVLGQVQIRVADRAVPVGPPQQCAVLAALAVDAGRPMSVEVLMDRVWGPAAPPGARRTLHTYVTRIRRLLERSDVAADRSERLVLRTAAGYVLDIDRLRVDLHRFHDLVARARESHCAGDRRAAMLREALDLWRGEPLTGLGGRWVERTRERCRQQHLDAVLAWAEAELDVGNPAVVVGPLTDLLDEYPLVEPLTAVLMRALHATGRDAEALDRYAATRERLVDDLGVDPGSALRGLHLAILRGELDRTAPAAPPVAAPARHVPAQLPPDVYGFAGRAGELDQLDSILDSAAEHPTAVVISALSGTAGVGKTALAVHWAHRVANRFGDGQLYVNLRGFDPGGSVMKPVEAVRGFLDAFAVPPQQVPAGLDAQIGLYRSLLAGRRVLVVLDNARDLDQVRPLLPGAPGCLVVVTSRNQLPGLVAAEGARPITLDLLSVDEARQLLTRRLGAARVAVELPAVDEIITRCARLPLALAIVAARAAIDPGLPLAALAGELHDARGSLDAFAGADAAIDARSVFSWSYHALSPGAASLFRLLGVHPGPDISLPAAASLHGTTPADVGPLLAELTRVHLVAKPAPGRFAFHDLLRAYAAELAHALDDEDDRDAAIRRVLDHYLHTGHRAARLLDPHRDLITLAAVEPGTTAEEPVDEARATAWLNAEHAVLLEVVRLAAQGGFGTHAWQLTWTLTDFFDRGGHWQDQISAHTAALAAARRLADRTGQAYAHRGLARAYARQGREDDAYTHYREALALFRELGDHTGQAYTHRGLAWVCEQKGRCGEALRHAEHALELYRTAGHRGGQARALNSVGWFHTLLGDHQQALTHCQQAISLHREIGDRPGEADTWDSLGHAHHQLGDHQQAAACYQHALELIRGFDDRYSEAAVLNHLGDTRRAAGDVDESRRIWQRALDILDQLGHPEADQVRAKLTG
ncbi:BTAD domain-containing putative transcriptional regulator [Plantactinospora sp. WMMB782]|uniref:AfsR/SARP family transcriptional regulator n=1 Tax=Plantactinospora sp. WMMB782 TaxID=3404121 RepID=UPI003B946070